MPLQWISTKIRIRVIPTYHISVVMEEREGDRICPTNLGSRAAAAMMITCRKNLNLVSPPPTPCSTEEIPCQQRRVTCYNSRSPETSPRGCENLPSCKSETLWNSVAKSGETYSAHCCLALIAPRGKNFVRSNSPQLWE